MKYSILLTDEEIQLIEGALEIYYFLHDNPKVNKTFEEKEAAKKNASDLTHNILKQVHTQDPIRYKI